MRFNRYLLFILLFPLLINPLSAQQTFEANCGDVIEQEFTSNKQSIGFKIALNGGDKLKVFAKGKYGKELKVAVAIVGPSGKVIADKKGYPTNTFEIETPILPAKGIYSVGICNYYRWNANSRGNLGPFIIEFICEKREGNAPEPVAEPQPILTAEPSYQQPAPNPVNSGASILQRGTFLNIPPNTPVTATVTDGTGQIQGFETELLPNTPTHVKIEMLEGSTPVQMDIIHRYSETVVFSSTLRFAKDLDVTLSLPFEGNYVVAFQEFVVPNGLKRPTKFRVNIGAK